MPNSGMLSAGQRLKDLSLGIVRLNSKNDRARQTPLEKRIVHLAWGLSSPLCMEGRLTSRELFQASIGGMAEGALVESLLNSTNARLRSSKP